MKTRPHEGCGSMRGAYPEVGSAQVALMKRAAFTGALDQR